MSSGGDITRLLSKCAGGDRSAFQDLVPLIYAELGKLAAAHLRNERAGHTLEPAALVHEAFLRLSDQWHRDAKNRSQFYCFASHVMRQVLVDHARARMAQKRGGDWERVTLPDSLALSGTELVDVLAIDEALVRLAALDQRKADVVEHRYFGGLSLEEIASVLQVSEPTVRRDLQFAVSWLHRELNAEGQQ
jgi:RNA polymerase sigma-70 factor, ECF subfamily